jgi:hypothetical protein
MSTPQSNWISVMDCGAKANSTTDDTPAINKAIQLALARPEHMGETVIQFPSAGQYRVGTPLVLPNTNKRITLHFDADVKLEAPIIIQGGYTLRGTECSRGGFTADGIVNFYAWPGASPQAILIQGDDVKLENIGVTYASSGNHGIVVDGFSKIKLTNVQVLMRNDNPTGIPLKITGGFGHRIEDCGFSSYGAPVILFSSTPSTTGPFMIRSIFTAGGSISIENTGGGGVDGVSIDGGLSELLTVPFLVLRTGANASGISGVDLRNIHNADSSAQLIDAHGPAGYLRSVTVVNCSAEGPFTTGDPIWGLEVWSATDYAPGVIAQKDHFIFHGPSGVKDTTVKL